MFSNVTYKTALLLIGAVGSLWIALSLHLDQHAHLWFIKCLLCKCPSSACKTWFYDSIHTRILDHGPEPCLQGSEGDNYAHIICRSALTPMFLICLRAYVPRSLEPWLRGSTILASPLDMSFLSNCISRWWMQNTPYHTLDMENLCTLIRSGCIFYWQDLVKISLFKDWKVLKELTPHIGSTNFEGINRSFSSCQISPFSCLGHPPILPP